MRKATERSRGHALLVIADLLFSVGKMETRVSKEYIGNDNCLTDDVKDWGL